MKDKVLNNGLIGQFKGWRMGGRSFDAEGNEITEIHKKNCYCCREDILTPKEQ